MKVKVIDPGLVVKLQDPKLTLMPGMIYDLPDDVAKRLISSHFVYEVREESQDKQAEEQS